MDTPESLTTVETIQLDGYLTNILTQLNRRDYLYEVGVYQTPIEEFFVAFRGMFENKFALAWWDERRTAVAGDQLREFLDRELQNIEHSGQALVFSNIKTALNAE